MTKAICRYCDVEASPRNLLRICTLPGEPLVVHVCETCHGGEYQIDRAAYEVSHMAAVMTAEAAGIRRQFRLTWVAQMLRRGRACSDDPVIPAR